MQTTNTTELGQKNLPTIESLTQTLLPTLFTDAQAISEYGESVINAESQKQYEKLMEESAVTALSVRIERISVALRDADPRKIAKEPGWFARFTGKHLEKQARYRIARENVESLIDEGKTYLAQVRQMLDALETLADEYAHEIQLLRVYIEAGREFLQMAPAEPEEQELIFDKPAERLSRKLANLATLQASHEMSLMHMKITRVQAIEIIDTFSQTIKILVPVWRQHSLALITTNTMNETLTSKASEAHRALMESLHNSLEGAKK
ncbi:toxic anion resistance protein [Pantoea agglomerans]|uniref:toxic anion resistance protein n=1 Tax=Enterobacter agglomerans TaxID=549 RepID=UPI003C7ED799